MSTLITREQFLAERRRGIGGSEIAAACGFDPRMTPYMLWREKRGLPPPEGKPHAMRRGNFLEAAILKRYAEIVQPAALEFRIAHDKGWRRGNQDARATLQDGRRVVVEAKSVNKNVFRFTKDDAQRWGDPWSDEVPRRALCQGLWYAALDDAQVIDFPVMVVPEDPDEVLGLTADEIVAISEFHIFRAARNATIEEFLVEEGAAFWRLVQDGIEPAPMNEDDVELRWPMSSPESIKVATPEVERWLLEFEAHKGLASAHGKKADVLREKLLIFAEGNEAIASAKDMVSPYLTLKPHVVAAHTRKESRQRPLHFTKWWTKHHAQIVERNPEPEAPQTPEVQS